MTLSNAVADFIEYEELKDAVVRILELKEVTDEQVAHSVALAEYIKALAIFRGMYREQDGSQAFMTALYAAAFLYRAYTYEQDGKVMPSLLMQARDDLMTHAPEIHEQFVDAICSSIEGQHGVQSPVKKFIAGAGTPTQLFSDAVFALDYFKGQ